jgi:transcriptional regulator with XRE-family HTH domain
MGYCTRCKKWLGAEDPVNRGSEYSALRPETADWEVWVANQVRDMIRTGFDKPALLTRQSLSQLLWMATDIEGLSAFARTLGVSPNCVTDWRSGRKLPMLPVYLRIARTFNVTLTELITGAIQPDSIHSLDTLSVPYWRNIRIGRKQHFDPLKAERQLSEALQESPPPSLRAFQKRTGYHCGTLQKHFPALCDALCQRFRQHQAEAIQKRHEEKIAEFRKIARQLHEQGIELFVHRVLKRMSVPLSLDHRLACSLLIQVKQELLKANRTHA